MPIPTAGELWRDALDAVLPQRCVVCDRFGAALHAGPERDCREALERAESPRCDRCWLPADRLPLVRRLCTRCEAEPPAFDGLRAPYRFVGPVHRAILEAKFRGVTALLEPLAEAAARVVPEVWAIDLIVPVPLHPRRERQRGYNQAAITARVVSGVLGVPRGELLRRVRATPAQAGLNASQRARNLGAAFASDPVSGVVLLVDDVATTGATFDAAARALRDAGAARVYALSLARED